MIGKHYPPAFKKENFHCVHCHVYAQQSWHQLAYRGRLYPIWFCACAHCKKYSYWHAHDKRMVVPAESTAEPPHPDLPDACKKDYEEARAVFSHSPRAAAALLRLAVQRLMAELGERGKDLNDDVAALVKKGLPVQIQKALDICRVVGNHAVHPGEINIDDKPKVAENLFRMINLIVDDRITRPKEMEKAYAQLPENARKAIEDRDKK